METAKDLVSNDEVVCTYQLTRCVKLQLVKSPRVKPKSTTVVPVITQAVAAVVLGLSLDILVSELIPQHRLRFLAMTCSMAGWAFIGLAFASRERHAVLIYLLSAILIFSAGIAGMNISISYLFAGLVMTASLPFLPMAVSRSSVPLPPERLAGWSVFYLVLAVSLGTSVLV